MIKSMLNINVKRLTLILILFLAAVSGWRMGYGRVLPQVAVSLAVALTLETAVSYKRLKKLVWSDAAAITGLIVGGVAAPNAPLAGIAAMSALAMVSKYVISIDRRNVFNPAAFGLLVGTVALKVPLSWWVDSTHLLTIAVGALLLVRLPGRWRMVFTFLAFFAALVALRAWSLGRSPLFDWYLYVSITSFFLFFMATDPRTAPIKVEQQPLFALLAAAGAYISVALHPQSIFLFGLIVANLVAAWQNHRTIFHQQAAVVHPPAAAPAAKAVI